MFNKNIAVPALILFIEGFYGLAYQMLVIRQLTPYVGSSIDVISWIVGVFLIFLAFGYKIGGNRKGDFNNILKNNFIIAALLAIITLSNFFLNIIFNVIGNIIGTYITMLLYLFICLAPIVILFGQTIPIITNKFKEGTISSINGNVLFLSTIGSFLGSIISTNIFIKYLGVSNTIMISNLLLLSCIFILDKEKNDIQNRNNIKSYLTTVIVMIVGVFFYLKLDNPTYIATTNYANYQVKKVIVSDNGIEKKGTAFSSNFSLSSILMDDGSTMGYIKNIQDKVFGHMRMAKGDILVIGAGGFVLSEDLPKNDVKFTYVDIDPKIKEIAETNFLKRKIQGTFIPEDGRYFLKANKKRFDITVLDAFSGANSIPQLLYSQESLELLKSNTKEGGWIIINSILDNGLNSDFSQKFYNTILSTFGFCYVENLNYKTPLSNVIFYCKNNPIKNKNLQVYFDDKNNANLEYKKMLESQ